MSGFLSAVAMRHALGGGARGGTVGDFVRDVSNVRRYAGPAYGDDEIVRRALFSYAVGVGVRTPGGNLLNKAGAY